MRTLHISTLLVLTFAIIFGAIMLTFPEIDLIIAKQFFREDGSKFFLNKHPLFEGIHNFTGYLVLASVISYGYIAYRAYKERPLFGITLKQSAFLFAVLIVGPGLVANSLFKDNWGRARPSQIVEFGGVKEFSPPLIIADQCERNCSFVSGDPSVGFHFFGLALLFLWRNLKLIMIPILSGGVFGITRIVQGAHFFSDVIYSGIFTYLTAYLLYLLLKKWENK